MNSKYRKILLGAVVFSFLFIIFNTETTYGQTGGYVPLSSAQDAAALGLNEPSNLSNILNSFFNSGLVILGFLTVLMVTYGGIEYMGSNSVFTKDSGKKRIQAAIGGIILALASWIILNTINPQLITGRINRLETDLQTQASIAVNLSDYTAIYAATISPGNPQTPLDDRQNFNLVQTADGYMISPNRVAIDTDGLNPPPFYDPDWQGQTSLGGLDANIHNYVVVPIGSNIPLGTRVTVINHTNNREVEAVVGDRGPTANGYGELSLNAGRVLGVWDDTMGNSAQQHDLTYIFHNNNN